MEVAILWPKVWSSKVKRLDEGNERIVAVTIAASKPICLINNACLPTQDSGSHTEYLECLDILHSIFMKYQGTYKVILCGDLNGTLLETRSNKHDKLLRNFVTELQLSTGISCGTTPTFHHHAGTSSSQIDYTLIQNRQLVSSYNILESPICSSAHVTILAKMNSTFPYTSQTVNQRQKKVIKLNWDRADRQLYRASVETALTPLNRQDSLDQQVSAVTESLIRASKCSMPKKTVGLKGPSQS